VKVFNQSNFKSLITSAGLFIPFGATCSRRFQSFGLKPLPLYSIYRPLKGTAMILFAILFIAVGFNRRNTKQQNQASAKFRRVTAAKRPLAINRSPNSSVPNFSFIFNR